MGCWRPEAAGRPGPRAGRWSWVGLLLVAALAWADSPAPEAASGWHAKTAVRAREFMVTAAHPLAVEAGRDAIRRGGSAVDAAIAAQLVLNLVEPQSSGIGGGAFMLVYSAAHGRLTGR